jgi:Ca2+-binding EF-hand superfamily protein
MEPIFLTIYLDKNNDGELSKEEVRVFIKKFGSGKNKSDSDVEKVIEILD